MRQPTDSPTTKHPDRAAVDAAATAIIESLTDDQLDRVAALLCPAGSAR